MSIATILDRAAEELGDRVAFGNATTGLSYEATRKMARAVARHVKGTGIERVGLATHNGPIVPATLFGAAWAGLTYAPLNYRLPAASMQRLQERIDPAAIASAEWLDGDVLEDVPLLAAPERPAVLLFTSGTSAEPKAALLSHTGLLAAVANAAEFASADRDDAAILAVPPFHIAGVVQVLTNVYAGRRVILVPGVRFSAMDWILTARDERVTHTFVVPTMLAQVVEIMEAERTLRIPTMRSLSYGGARMPVSILERAQRVFPDCEFVNKYGLTETSGSVAALDPGDHRATLSQQRRADPNRLMSSGRALPGIEIQIVDEAGVSVAPDIPGEIQIRGPQVSGRYLDSDPSVDAEGWLHTGDRGWLDPDGYLYCEGRADDTIIRGGENIGPAEIEDVLLQHPSIATAAVVGLADEKWGEKIAAMITLRPGVDEVDVDQIRGWVRERLGSLKTPEIVVVAEKIPQTATDKIMRRQVKVELERHASDS